MSVEALEAMKGLVNVVMTGITNVGAEGVVKDGLETNGSGNGGDNGGEEGGENGGSSGDISKIKPDTLTELGGDAMAQLCMLQLVVGYNLRDFEVREQLKNR